MSKKNCTFAVAMEDKLDYKEWSLIQTIAMSKTKFLKKTPKQLDAGASKSFTYLNEILKGDPSLVYRRIVELHHRLTEEYPQKVELFHYFWADYFPFYELLWARMYIIASYFYYDDPLWQEKILPDMFSLLRVRFAREDVQIAARSIDNYYKQMAKYTPQEPRPDEPEPVVDTSQSILPVPEEGKYTEVRKYIEERKRFDEEFKQFCSASSLRDICNRLTDEFGWLVDENSLGKNINRHNKRK